MASWAEDRGATLAFVCEHHCTGDGYLPSPLLLATALAARTSTLRIMVTVVVLPLYEPVRLAEDMVVLDISEPRARQLRRRGRLQAGGIRAPGRRLRPAGPHRGRQARRAAEGEDG